MNIKMSIERDRVMLFYKSWNNGHFKGLRLGQAFYNEFNLHILHNQERLLGLYEKDGDDAKLAIREIFEFC